MAYHELTVPQIEKWLGIKRSEVPKYLVLYASWPWPLVKRLKEVRSYLKHPASITREPKSLGEKELGNFWIGEMGGKKVGFMLVYGHGMAADMLYLMIKLGVKYIFQIGSIGSLQSNVNLFDLVIPTHVKKFEGLSHHFFKQEVVKCDPELFRLIKEVMKEENFTNFHTGKIMSIDFLFAETKERVKKWSQKGFLGIDMETATTYAVSKLLRAKSIAILRVIDNLVKRGELISDLKYKDKKNEKMKIFVRSVINETISKLD